MGFSMQTLERADRYGNAFAPGLPYARGRILTSTETDIRKIQHAWAIMKARGADKVYNFTGLEHGFPMEPAELALMTDELAPSFFAEKLRDLTLQHLGGRAPAHDVALLNRITAATICTALCTTQPGDTIIGVSASYSHPSVTRAANVARANFIDVTGADALERELAHQTNVKLIVMTRLAVTYEILPLEEIQRIIAMARSRDITLYVDDAGGARVGPAIFDQPKMLDLGADLVATGLDKYGTRGPRFGLLAGRADLVSKIRARAWELAMEARPMLFPAVVHTLESYTPERVRELVRTTKEVNKELKARFGDAISETPTIGVFSGEDILATAMRRSGTEKPPIVPFEATAALCMALLKDFGVLTVHFVGLPPGTGDLLIKFIPPEVLSKFGGVSKYVDAMDRSLDTVAGILNDTDRLTALYFG